MKQLKAMRVLLCVGVSFGVMSCAGTKTPVGNPSSGALASLTFDNSTAYESMMGTWVKKPVFKSPEIDGNEVAVWEVHGPTTVPLYNGSHQIRAALVAGVGTDSSEPGLVMNFRAAPGRAYVLTATTYVLKGFHEVKLLEDAQPIRVQKVPFNNRQRYGVMTPMLPVR